MTDARASSPSGWHAVRQAIWETGHYGRSAYDEVGHLTSWSVDGESIGTIAAQLNHVSVLRAWLHAGGSMHRQHVHPQTLQILGIRDTIGHIAARHDHVDIFDLWHAHGGSIMDRTDNGMSIGHVAGQCGSSRVLAQWFTCGGDPSVVSGYGMTIGHTIAYTAHLRSSQHDGYMQCLSTWIDAGGHPDVHDHQGCSIGCHALRHENMAMLRGWIERGGCIFGHTGTQDIIKAVCAMPSTVVDHTKPCIVIAKTALRCMGFDLPHLPYMEEKAFRDQKGSAYAMRVLASMPDPIAMGMFAMVIDRYASAP